MSLAVPFLFALMVSAALVPICRTVALRLGYIVKGSDRQPASRPKALFGGVAIALTLFACAAAAGVFETVPVLLLCSGALFAVGLSSDVFTLKPSTTLVAIVAAASALLLFDYRLHWSDSLTLDSLVTLFWIVGITSAFNLLDSMDGLCGGIALIAGTAFVATVLPVPAEGALLLRTQYLAVLLGGIAGFLIYNVHPASIALGESGSLFIGLNMAAMTLQIAPGRGSDLLSIIAVPLLLVLIPIADATVAAVSRLVPVSTGSGSQDRSSHRLVAIGMSERSAVGLLWLLAAISGLFAVMANSSQQGIAGLLAAMFTIAVALFAVYLARVKIHEDVDPYRLPGVITPLGIALGYRRRLAEVLLDVLLIAVAYYGAYRLQFDADGFLERFPYFLQSFPIVLGTQVVALFALSAYQGMWRYFSLSDGLTFVKAVFIGVAMSQVAVLYVYGFDGYSPTVFVVYGMLLLLLLVGSRGSFRLLSEFVQRERQTGRRLAIYGAGDAGAIAARHLLTDPGSTYRIVGFIDDDFRLRNVRLHGYRVIGGYDHLVGMIVAGDIDAVAITDDRLDTQGLATLCTTYGVSLRRLAIDWREIGIGQARIAGNVALVQTPRVVRFTGARGRATGQADDRVAPTPSARPAEGLADAPQRAPIRVVHIITRLILGGAQENTLATAIAQHRDPRFDVTLLCGVDEAGEGNMFTPASQAGVNIVVMPSLMREIRPFADLKAIFDVYRFLRQESFTIVHTHSSKAGVIGRLAAAAARVPVVVHTQHGLAFHEFQSAWRNRLYVALERLCAPLTEVVVSVSARLGESALAHGIGRSRQHLTIFSGIELDLFLAVEERLTVEEAKRRAGIPPGARVVGKIARFFELKGHEQFLAAAAKIVQELPDTYFLLVGDGPLRTQFAADATEVGLQDRLVLAGRVDPEAVPEYIQAMDVVVHTSLREGIARVLPQAGAVGKPVVTFALDGAPEVIRDGVSGYLVPPVDTDAIAERVVELLRDPNRCRAFGQAGRGFAAEHFSVARMVERISALYLELVDRKVADRIKRGGRVGAWKT